MSQEEGFEGCCGVTSARDERGTGQGWPTERTNLPGADLDVRRTPAGDAPGWRTSATALKTRLAETAGEITVLVTGATVLRIIDVPDLRY